MRDYISVFGCNATPCQVGVLLDGVQVYLVAILLDSTKSGGIEVISSIDSL